MQEEHRSKKWIFQLWGHYWFGEGVESREGRDEIKDGYKRILLVSLKFDSSDSLKVLKYVLHFLDSLIGIEVCIILLKSYYVQYWHVFIVSEFNTKLD